MSELKDAAIVTAGKHLVERYFGAEQELRRAKSAENSADCEMKNATNALGKWLCPVSAKDGDKFCIWHLGNLIEAERVDMHTFKIVIRERARP